MFEKNGFALSTIISNILYILKTKINLLLWGQLSKQELDIKITSARIYL